MKPQKKDRIEKFFCRDEAFFIGRSAYISEFRQRVRNYSEKPLWSIHGVGGIGKSMLCNRLNLECQDLEYPHAFIDLADLRYRNIAEVLSNLADQMPIKHVRRFENNIDKYQRMEQERYESVKLQIVNQGGAVIKGAAGAAEPFFYPGLGFISGITIDAVKTMLDRHFKGKDKDFFLNAPVTLSHSFIEDLEHSFRSYKFGKLPLVIFIDTYEMGQYSLIDEFFRALVCNSNIKAFYVFSGRAKLETDEGRAWKQSGILDEQEELLPFTNDECAEYLDKVEIFDSELRKMIINHTQCFPFFMWLATKLVSSDPEALKDMPSLKKGLDKEKVAKFLFERIIERANLTKDEETLIYSAAIPRWFDRPTLGCLLGYNLAETRRAYKRLQSLDFVRSIGPDRANYHQIVKDVINLRWQDEEHKKKKSMHHTLGEYFLERHIQHHDFSCLLENYYHRFNIDFKQAFVDWTEDFKKIKNSLNMQDLTAVLLDFETYFMPLLQYEPEYGAYVFLTIGDRFSELTYGDIPEFKEKQIDYYGSALEVYTREAFPVDWAKMQNNLGNAYGSRIRGNRADNLEEAIACHMRNLEVRTKDACPINWATTQNNLGNAFRKRIRGNRADNLEEAIKCYTCALEVRKKEDSPVDWATTYINLGAAYGDRIKGDRADNLEEAIAYYTCALEVYTREASSVRWAATQDNLGIAYRNRIKGDRENNLEEAIAYHTRALEVRTREDFPVDFARTQNNLGIAYGYRIKKDRTDNLEKAIACYSHALKVRTKKTFPVDWATTQNNLGIAYEYRITGDRTDNLETAIACYTHALEVRTKDASPADWATTHINLGNAYGSRIKGDRADNLETAIECYTRALEVCTEKTFPVDWATIQCNLGNAYGYRIKEDRTDNIETAIACYTHALEVRTKDASPADWATTQNNLGNAYVNRIKGDRAENLVAASACYTCALEVYTQEAFPVQHSAVNRNLAEIKN